MDTKHFLIKAHDIKDDNLDKQNGYVISSQVLQTSEIFTTRNAIVDEITYIRSAGFTKYILRTFFLHPHSQIISAIKYILETAGIMIYVDIDPVMFFKINMYDVGFCLNTVNLWHHKYNFHRDDVIETLLECIMPKKTIVIINDEDNTIWRNNLPNLMIIKTYCTKHRLPVFGDI